MSTNLGMAATVPPGFMGTHVHDIGAGAMPPPAAFGGVRLWDARVVWPNLEPQRGQWSFERLDRAVAQLAGSKQEILLPLGLSPRWASVRPDESSAYAIGNAAPPARIEDWENYVKTVAMRYRGQVHLYEIWNEPNKERFFSGDVASMVALTCAAYRVLKQVDPSSTVVSPAATTQLEGARWLDAFLAAGGAACIDVVGFHFYTLAHEPPEAVLPLIDAVRAAMQKNGASGKPLWDTEFGWYIANARVPVEIRFRILDSQTAGAYLARSLILQASAGVQRAYYYAWNNRFMGAIEPDTGQLKSFGGMFGELSTWLIGADIGACAMQAGVWECPLRSKTGLKQRLVWVPATSSAQNLSTRLRGRSIRTLSGDSDGGGALARGEPVLIAD